MEEKEKSNIIDLRKVAHRIWRSKRFFYKVWGVTFVLACVWIFPQPRYYTSSVVLAPESVGEMTGGTLGSLASNFGINLGNMASNDAIYPLLYPDVIGSKDFVVGLLNIPVRTIDGEVSTDYHDYLVNYSKKSPWDYPQMWLRMLKNMIFPNKTYPKPEGMEDGGINPFMLSPDEYELVASITDRISCNVDKKTDVITISVLDQDPLVCATMADSVRARLQQHIIDYRTSKARIDFQFYERLAAETKVEYEKALSKYSRYAETHSNMILQTYISERDKLENEVQNTYASYQTINTQLQMAKAKVQEKTPAFTTLEGASVPIKPAGPKRVVFVVVMLFLSTIGAIVYLFKDDIIREMIELK